jgi:hypothetical protein
MPTPTRTAIAPPVFWQRWLLIASAAVVLFGLALVALPAPTQRLFNWIAFAQTSSPASFSAEAVAYAGFLSAVLGAVMAGWGLTMLMIVAGPFSHGDRGAWWTLTLPLLLWFVPDTAVSIGSGFWRNAVFNLGFALVFGLPLFATRRLGLQRRHSP